MFIKFGVCGVCRENVIHFESLENSHCHMQFKANLLVILESAHKRKVHNTICIELSPVTFN